tara:strand:+ start:1968 stop:2111 length:144 start_codon:yes stop_codon:yes gene_type:complete
MDSNSQLLATATGPKLNEALKYLNALEKGAFDAKAFETASGIGIEVM